MKKVRPFGFVSWGRFQIRLSGYGLPAQHVDATQSNQLIGQCLPIENGSVELVFISPYRLVFLYDSTLANDVSVLDSRK
jgi:hypothetical protein